ncbi:hypothetical protein [Brevundimonas sp. SORGH_AS_0993]|uniref:hypothetical protein n=1 Tax=Brevundimonas sp. SORGH_AS_0993 TaxID=3041794 RepID=UPI00278760B1|nr:hypothetical protein [Brevundimonas sp. SORGH_AS_0993]MDQ1153278.1 ElaB/YqjD/DUF883 family membrane-anchored ribosome-binding protein [Brevundimonas sp. SORGH_AS_0993]
MTQSPIAPPSPDDIVLEDDGLTQRLDREADALLAKEDRAFERVSSVRQAVREDAAQVRDVMAQSVAQARDGIREEPMRATLYALGLGVLIGMLLRR